MTERCEKDGTYSFDKEVIGDDELCRIEHFVLLRVTRLKLIQIEASRFGSSPSRFIRLMMGEFVVHVSSVAHSLRREEERGRMGERGKESLGLKAAIFYKLLTSYFLRAV